MNPRVKQPADTFRKALNNSRSSYIDRTGDNCAPITRAKYSESSEFQSSNLFAPVSLRRLYFLTHSFTQLYRRRRCRGVDIFASFFLPIVDLYRASIVSISKRELSVGCGSGDRLKGACAHIVTKRKRGKQKPPLSQLEKGVKETRGRAAAAGSAGTKTRELQQQKFSLLQYIYV